MTRARDGAIGTAGESVRPRRDRWVDGRFRLVRPLARGGQAEVWVAEQVALRRMVALKLLHPPAYISPQDLAIWEQRFRREAQLQGRLHHPGIVQVYDFGRAEDGQAFIAMELIDGHQLRAGGREGRLEPARALSLIRQLACALEHVHAHGVLHRDVKDSNVLVRRSADGTERVVLTDFGIAKRLAGDPELTRQGLVLGSPRFMAPEQARGKAIDHRIDVYAIGVILFMCLVGRPPFEGESSTDVMAAHVVTPVPSFNKVLGKHSIPAAVEGLVRRCMAKDVTERIQSMTQLKDEIDTVLGMLADGSAQVVDPAEAVTEERSVLPGPLLARLLQAPPARRLWFLMATLGAAMGSGFGVLATV